MSATAGRFYLLYSQGGTGAAFIWETEGNFLVGSTHSRLKFLPENQIFWSSVYGIESGNTALMFDLMYDHNLRSATTTGDTGSPAFMPYMDGIINGELRDQDDGAVLRSNLRCAFGTGPCQ